MTEEPRRKFEQGLAWLFLGVLLVGCALVLKPFAIALLWAVILSFSLWPIYSWLVRVLKGRRGLASVVLTLGLALVVLVPFVVVGATLADNVKDLTNATRRWIEAGPPEPPSWLAKVPIVGEKAVNEWQGLAADTSKLFEELKRFIEPASLWLLKSGLALTKGVLEFTLSILISFFLLRDGTALGERLISSMGRIAGQRGQYLLQLAGNTVRGVVYGILGTAFLQAILAALGFLFTGVPSIPLLALLTFVSCIVPGIGAALVWIPAAFWLFHQDQSGRAIFLIIWGVGVSSLDNFVKPWLISQGSKMPFVLIFFGVIGGALAFGFIGFFIGPTLLAVGYKLIDEWVSNKPTEPSLQTSSSSSASSSASAPPSPSQTSAPVEHR